MVDQPPEWTLGMSHDTRTNREGIVLTTYSVLPNVTYRASWPRGASAAEIATALENFADQLRRDRT